MRDIDYTYKIPFGPQHPALKEIIHLRFEVSGEQIISVDLRPGYMHRGIEEALSRRPFNKGLYLSERICGICSHAHAQTFCQAVEKAAKVEIPERAKYIRSIVAELERLHSHMLLLGVMAHEIGFDTVFHYFWRDREYVMDLFEMLTGNRVNYSVNCLGGVRFDITDEIKKEIENAMERIMERAEYYEKSFIKDATIKKRTKKIGYLSKNSAEELSIVGPNARASGVKYDIRETKPYLIYDNHKPIVDNGCDVYARMKVRLKEVRQSAKFVLDNLDLPETRLKTPFSLNIKPNEAVGRTEAPRGELFYYVKANGQVPERIKVRTPTFAAYHMFSPVLKGQYVADIPIIVASTDPCIACADRIILVENGKEKIVTKEELCQYSSSR